MPTAAEYAANYLKGAAELRAAVQGMSREQLLARPIPGKWSTLEVVAHLADFEPIIADRMKRILSHENPTLLGADEELFAKALHYQDRDLNEELAVIDATRTAMARLIEKVTPEQMARSGVHSEKGPKTFEQILQLAIFHINHHLPFILDKRRALGL